MIITHEINVIDNVNYINMVNIIISQVIIEIRSTWQYMTLCHIWDQNIRDSITWGKIIVRMLMNTLLFYIINKIRHKNVCFFKLINFLQCCYKIELIILYCQLFIFTIFPSLYKFCTYVYFNGNLFVQSILIILKYLIWAQNTFQKTKLRPVK